jgi:pilus assembly protein Flp/PilA
VWAVQQQVESKGDMSMKTILRKFCKDEKGATAIEYGLIAALIAVVLITTLGLLGNNMSSRFNQISSKIGTAR